MSFFLSLLNAMPGAITQGMLWGIMAIGVYITYRILDVADLTVDGSLATGGAVCVMLMRAGWNPWAALLCAFLAGVLAGLCTGLLHTRCGIPAILAGILTQLALYSVNLRIMTGKANQPIGVDKYDLLVSQRYVRTFSPVGELLTKNPLPLLLLFVALLAGLATGLVTGLLHTFMGIPAILAGILTQLSLYSVNLKIMGKANQAINVDKFNLLVSLRRVKGVALTQNTLFIVAIMIIILIAVLYWFFGTELGCSLRATGCNPSMSRAQGINTDRNKVLGLMLSNGLVALSSALLAQYQGFADVNMGRGAIVIGLAAVIIGEAIFGKIFHNFALRLLSVAFGSILYYLVLQTVIWMGIDTDLLKMPSALVVAVFLAVPYWKAKYFSKPVKRGGNK